jgi:WD40 repeat protein
LKFQDTSFRWNSKSVVLRKQQHFIYLPYSNLIYFFSTVFILLGRLGNSLEASALDAHVPNEVLATLNDSEVSTSWKNNQNIDLNNVSLNPASYPVEELPDGLGDPMIDYKDALSWNSLLSLTELSKHGMGHPTCISHHATGAIAIGTLQGAALIYSIAPSSQNEINLQYAYTLNLSASLDLMDPICSTTWSSSGESLAIGYESGRITLWDTAQRALLHDVQPQEEELSESKYGHRAGCPISRMSFVGKSERKLVSADAMVCTQFPRNLTDIHVIWRRSIDMCSLFLGSCILSHLSVQQII